MQVGELLTNANSATGSSPFNSTNLTTLVNMIYGASGSVSTQLSSLKTSTATTPLTAADLRAKTYNKTANKSIVVRLGGLDWIVTYVSNDINGNLIATLWLSNNHQAKWGWNGSGGEDMDDAIGPNQVLDDDGYIVFANGGLYSTWVGFIQGTHDNLLSPWAASMYGTSFIRVATLNNPDNRQYANIDNTLSSEIAQNEDHIFSLYTVASKGLTQYLSTPNKMPWINAVQDPSLIGEESLHSNDSLSTAAGNYGTFDYTSVTGYTNWETDYLFLPSIVEMGVNNTDDGLWETNWDERSTYDGSSDYIDNSALDNSDMGEACPYSWSRSIGTSITSSSPQIYYSTGADAYSSGSDGDWNAVRPCLLLNLDYVINGPDTDPSTGTNTITVTLDKQNGTGGTTSVTVENNTLHNITPPTKNNYTFGGYYTSTNGGGTKIYNANGTPVNSTSTFTSSTTLYAKWTGFTYYIKYNANGGSGTMSNSTHEYGTYKNLTANTFTRTGYTFSGWATSSNGAKVYNNSASVRNLTTTSGATVNLYAVWQGVTVTITLNNQSATTAGSTSVSATYNAALSNITPPTRDGYIFGGYYTETNGGGTKIYNADGTPAITTSTFTTNATLYASWTPAIVTLSFDRQGATAAGIATQTVTYNSALSNITAPTRTGYTFGGYYLFPSGQGTKIYNANGTPAISLSTFAADTTLYAYWLWYDIKSVTGSTTSYTLYDSVDTTMKNTSLTIAPATGHKVASFSFDNTTWHNVDSVKKNLANTSLAAAVIYYANENSNEIVFEFKGICATSPISFYLQTTAGAYSGLKNSANSVKGVYITSTLGGMAYILGDDIENLEDDDTITLAADITLEGYGFKHWKTADGRVLSTAQSVRLKKSLVNDSLIIAVFEPVSSSNVNLEVDNTE